jgi:hypothetical protein
MERGSCQVFLNKSAHTFSILNLRGPPETTVTVTARKGISVEGMRSRVASYFKTDDVSVCSSVKAERQVEYDYDELEILKNPHQTPQP